MDTDLDDERESIRAQIEEIDAEVGENEYQIHQLHERQEQLSFQRALLTEKLDLKSAVKAKKLSDFEGTEFPWSQNLQQTLQAIFKIKDLRPQQLPTINATMSGCDCILIMPTGGGKSLCFQLPALLTDGITLVVSPLVSLMEDQLMALRNLNINAEILSAATPKAEHTRILQEMINPKSKLKMLYVTPEKLSKSKMFLSRIQKMYGLGLFARLAVDEVHCCSQWGHDFRKDYKFLGVMKRQFPSVPILGLTATATSRVVLDVQKMLSIENCLVLRAPFNRPNLVYKVFPKPSVIKEVIEELAKIIRSSYSDQSGIVYCLSIKETEEVASELQKRNINALPYHANLEAKYRSMVHTSWMTNKIQVVVATIAFGMGIDKPDVRFVIHHTMSRTIENYYQESGRAGRDNKPADCIIFYRFGDIFRQSGMVISDSTGLTHLYAMVAFCTERKRCHRATLADHFGELWNEAYCNKMCDNCNPVLAYGGSKSKITETVNILNYYHDICKILDNAKALKQNLTALKLLDTWTAKGKSNICSTNAVPPKYPRAECERIITHLLLEGYLQEKFSFTAYNTISYVIKALNVGCSAVACGLVDQPRVRERLLHLSITICLRKTLQGVRTARVGKGSCKIEMELIKLPGCGRPSNGASTDASTIQISTSKTKSPAIKNKVKGKETPTTENKTGSKPCVVNRENSKFSKCAGKNKKKKEEKSGITMKSQSNNNVSCDLAPDLLFDDSLSFESSRLSEEKKLDIIEIDNLEPDRNVQSSVEKLKQPTSKRKATSDKTYTVSKKPKLSS